VLEFELECSMGLDYSLVVPTILCHYCPGDCIPICTQFLLKNSC
jgi:hypothetical protein